MGQLTGTDDKRLSGGNPIGGSPQLSIDNNGLITGTPNRGGKFVVSVCVSEWDRRTRRLLGTLRPHELANAIVELKQRMAAQS